MIAIVMIIILSLLAVVMVAALLAMTLCTKSSGNLGFGFPTVESLANRRQQNLERRIEKMERLIDGKL